MCERAHTKHGPAPTVKRPDGYSDRRAPATAAADGPRCTTSPPPPACPVGTVSRVLNGGYVSAEARAAIEAAIAEVGYVPNTAARNLVPPPLAGRRLPRPGAALAAAGGPEHRRHHARRQRGALGGRPPDGQPGRRLATATPSGWPATCSGGFVDGAIIVSARAHDPITRLIAELGLPATFVGHPPDLHHSIPFVGIDNVGSARTITQRLMATGRRRIGMIAAALDRDSGADRLTGFRAGARRRASTRTWSRRCRSTTTPTASRACACCSTASPLIDGVFAASDAVAAGALEVLREAGRSVPGDVGVVGFDDSSWALRTQPPLSTVHQPAREIGQNAAELVLLPAARHGTGRPQHPARHPRRLARIRLTRALTRLRGVSGSTARCRRARRRLPARR